MKRPSGGQSSGGRERRRRTDQTTVIRFRTEVEYANRAPHIITLRPTQIQNATPNQVAAHVVRELRRATLIEARAYFSTYRQRAPRSDRALANRLNVVINGIFYSLL